MSVERLTGFKEVAGKFRCEVSFAFRFSLVLLVSIMTIGLSFSPDVYAGHPLSTDDTGTQGKGKAEFDIHSEFVFDKTTESGIEIKTSGGELKGQLTYGVLNNVDLVLAVPYTWGKVKVEGITVYDEKGLSDLCIEAKWRFLELENGLSFAIKPGITLPTGDDKKGLGNGKATYGVTFITTKEFNPWAFHFNAGYKYNDNKLEERKDLWNLSAAIEVEVLKKLKIVAELGIGNNPDSLSNTNPAFATGGVIYKVTESIAIDFGIRAGLNKAVPDMAVLAGIAMYF